MNIKTTRNIPLIALTAFLAFSQIGLAREPHYATDPSTPEKDARMTWWREARFGLFIHWGLYAVPAGEWKGEKPGKGYAEWIQHTLQIPLEEYTQLAKDFNPVKFDADQWADIAYRAGMRYFVLTTKHHEGFALFDSAVSEYDIMDASPYKKDLYGALSDAFRARGMHTGAYYSHDVDWSVPQGRSAKNAHHARFHNVWDFPLEKVDENVFDHYLETKALPQVRELIQNHKPDLIWFDTPINMPPARGWKFHDLVRELSPNTIINGRIARPHGILADYRVPGDNGYFSTPQGYDWECCATMSETWGYKKELRDPKSTDYLIGQLSMVVSAGGNLLLNIGPKPDGTIPERSMKILETFADWMKPNAESIHCTNGNPFDEFFSWGLVTHKPGNIYLHILDWNDGETVSLPRLNNKVSQVTLLGDPERSLKWKQNGTDLNIELKGEAVFNSVSVVKVEYKDPLNITPVQLKEKDGKLELKVAHAQSRGNIMAHMRHQSFEDSVVIHIRNGRPAADEHIIWDLDLLSSGRYQVVAECIAPNPDFEERTLIIQDSSGNEISKVFSPQTLVDNRVVIGEIEIEEAGNRQIQLRLNERHSGQVYLTGLRLERML